MKPIKEWKQIPWQQLERRVFKDNRGKKTAGIDGVKSLTPAQRLALVKQLNVKAKVQATRRVWIAKPGGQEKRPLGIPTMRDRALQALVNIALHGMETRIQQATPWHSIPGTEADHNHKPPLLIRYADGTPIQA